VKVKQRNEEKLPKIRENPEEFEGEGSLK